jgi:hypothetical protein
MSINREDLIILAQNRGQLRRDALSAIYYMFFELTLGATPAKLLTGSRVFGIDDSKPTPLQIFKRTPARSIPFEPFSFFIGNSLHDGMSHTKVVKEEVLSLILVSF